MPDISIILLSHVAATLFMTGLIWFVQVVHYPMFASVGRGDFARYEIEHSMRTAWVVGPVMIVEALTGFLIYFWVPLGSARPLMTASVLLLLAIWLSTAILQMPQHRRLSVGFDEAVHRLLVSSNVFRTIGWSARSILLLMLLHRILSSSNGGLQG